MSHRRDGNAGVRRVAASTCTCRGLSMATRRERTVDVDDKHTAGCHAAAGQMLISKKPKKRITPEAWVDTRVGDRYATMEPKSAATCMHAGSMEVHLASTSTDGSSCASEGASAYVSIGCSSLASSMGSSFASGSSTLGGVGFGWLRIGTQRRSNMSLFL